MRVSLNDVETLLKLDTIDALGDTYNYDKQFAEGYELAKSFDIQPLNRKVDEILMCGTGGGSMASINLLKSYLFDEIKVPIVLNQGYTIPAFVDKDTLVFIMTHSGNTEEIVSCYKQAIDAGAQIIVLTAGGTVKQMALEHGHPMLNVPGGMMPRIVPGYIFLPILVILHKLGLVSDPDAAIKETISLFSQLKDQYGVNVPIENNLAKQIAIEMDGLIPVVYGTLPLTDSVAWRFKNQLGENSKLMAFWNAIPALHHDEAVGWDADSAMLKQFHFTLIRDAEDSEKNAKRVTITAEILRDRVGAVREVTTIGNSRMARLFSAIYLLDFVTLYLPLLRGVDPTPVDVLNIFKAKMGQPQLFVSRRS
jgi:glucose/mannose-6-phosphate isomerase